jgi:hypothetical protein
MNALLLHELERLGLSDHDALREDAIKRARSIEPPEVGTSVARVIMAIFDGEPPDTPDADFIADDGQADVKH